MKTIRLAAMLLLWPTLALAVPPGWTLAELRAQEVDLFARYVPTVCALKRVLGSEYQTILDEEYAGGAAGAGEAEIAKADTAGGAISYRSLFQEPTIRLLWVHPDGKILVAISRDGEPTRIVVNDKAIQSSPPPVLTTFLAFADQLTNGDDEATRKGLTPIWEVHQDDLASCRGAAQEAEQRAQAEVAAGIRCDEAAVRYGTFDERPFLVVPAADAPRVAVTSKPASAAEGDKTPFLVAGDLVQLLTVPEARAQTHGFVCAYYRSKGGSVTTGWVPKARLTPLTDGPEPMMSGLPAPKGWLLRTEHRNNFPGKYLEDQRYVVRATIVPKGKGLSLTLTANYAGERSAPLDEDGCTSSFKLTLRTPRSAISVDEGETTARAYRFNNALWITAPEFCDETTFGGLFYTAPEK